MSIVWADVTAIAPELVTATVPVATQTVLLAISDRQVDDTAWGEFADDGRRYLAAHLGTLYASGGGAGGYVTDETVGPLSVSYGLPSGVSGELSTTKYGIEYKRLLRIAIAMPAFVA